MNESFPNFFQMFQNMNENFEEKFNFLNPKIINNFGNLFPSIMNQNEMGIIKKEVEEEIRSNSLNKNLFSQI